MRQVISSVTLCFGLAFGGAARSDCPPVSDISSKLDVLIEEINAAENDLAARDVSAKMWRLWLTAPDEVAQTTLDQGMRARASYDFVAALDAFNRLAVYCPEYAEGYNQRAFVHFLTGNYEDALVDLDKALDLSPRHVGAQSGRALTLMNLGRLAEARVQLLAALENNPWLAERFLLSQGGPLAEEGEDI